VAQDRVRDYTQDGLALYRHGNFVDARDTFEAALELQPDDAVLMYDLGQCYDRIGDAAKAEKLYRTCLERAPDLSACRQALCRLLVRERRSPEAGQIIEDWLIHDPKCAAAYAIDGWMWHLTGDLPRAQARLQQALLLDPRDPLALTELALVYEALNRPERALVLYERSLARDPEQPEVLLRLAVLRAQGAGRPKPDE
jgi:Flp pilus assembly protein TadD